PFDPRFGRELFRFPQEVVDLRERPFGCRDLRSWDRRLGRGRDDWFRRPFSEGLAADFAFDEVRIVVGPAGGTKDEVEDVLLFRGSLFGVGLEFRGTPRALRVAPGDEGSAIRANEQEPDLPLLEDPIWVSIAQLLRMAEARLEQFQRALAVEAEGSAEPHDRRVFGGLAAGLVFGTMGSVLTLSLSGYESLWVFVAAVVLEESFKLVYLNRRSYQGRFDTTFYGIPLGIGIAASGVVVSAWLSR